jgi:hypothetical protein
MTKFAEKYQAFVEFRRANRILLTVFLLLVICVVFIGLNDIPGYILGYIATTVLFFMMIRRWRSIKRFLLLFVLSVIGIIFLSFLHAVIITGLAIFIWGDTVLQSTPFRIIEWSITYIILFGGPIGMFAGLTGVVVLGVYRLIPEKNKEKVAGST